MVFRAAGWGMRVCVIQFIKGDRPTGEQKAAQRFESIEWHALGDGFTWNTNNPQQDQITTHKIWIFAKEKIRSGKFDLVLLDEINYCLYYKWLTEEEVTHFILTEKPTETHLILTGRGAPPQLITLADTVTQMQEVKHAFELGITAKRGIEF